MAVTKTKVIVLTCYLVTFAAGAIMGLVWSLPEEPAWGRGPRPFDLDLTEKQREEMKEIWSETVGVIWRRGEPDRQQILRERDEAVKALLSEEKQQQFDEIYAKFFERMDEVSRRRREAFEAANERTREILTDAQRKKFDEMLEKRRERVRGRLGDRPWRGRPDGRRGRPRHHPPSEKSSEENSQRT